MKKETIAFLIQGINHYNETLKIAKRLEQNFDILLLLNFHPETLGITQNIPYKHFVLSPNFDLTTSNEIKQKLVHSTTLYNNLFAIMYRTFNICRSVIRWGSFIARMPIIIFNATNAYVQKHFSLLSTILKDSFRAIFSSLYLYQNKSRRIRNLTDSKQFSLLVLNEGNAELYSEIFIKACHQKNIPVVILPYTICSPSEPAQFYYNSFFHSSSFIANVFFKKWVYEYNNKKLIRLPLLNIISQTLLRIAPPEPWVQESSTADVLVAESTRIQNHYLQHNIPSNQIQCLGNVNLDIIYDALHHRKNLKTELLKELGYCSSNKPIITFAVFPDLTNLKEGMLEFKSYREILAFIVSALKKIGNFNSIICLHPSMDKSNFAFLESDSIKISSRLTPELLVISDIYIASISSTIKWAISLGIPVINYDVYKLRYNDYISAEGVLTVESKAAFKKALKKLTQDLKYYEDIKEKQISVSNEWGIIDGSFTPQLIHLINNLIRSYKEECYKSSSPTPKETPVL